MIENKLGITSGPELAEAEEKISKKKAIELFESGMILGQKFWKIARRLLDFAQNHGIITLKTLN